MAILRFLAKCSVVIGLSQAVFAQDVTIFDEALVNGFVGSYSYGGVPGNIDFASTAQAHSGTHAVAFTGNGFNAVAFTHESQSFSVPPYSVLSFWVHGGSGSGQQLELFLYADRNAAANAHAPLDGFIVGGGIAAGQWRLVNVPLTQPPLSFNGSLQRIDLQNQTDGAVQPTLYLDDIRLQASGSGPIFSDDFEGVILPPAANVLRQEQNIVSADNMLSDRFTWYDSAGQLRVAVLAHNDGQFGPSAGGYQNRGGALREFQYRMPNGTQRVAGVTNYGNGGYGGFGYVVSHSHNTACNGDDSPLGYSIPGAFERVFQGRHHAIFRFTQNYQRHCSPTAPAQTTLLPVTIDWLFSTGHDDPLWAITYDLSAIPVNYLDDDSRAPYGELNIDGQGFTAIDGVAWGDRFRFNSTNAPLTLNSNWTWNTANTVPFVKLWITSSDATMGIVQTQTIAQQDAGGGRDPFYHDITAFWGKTSANGNAGDGYRMPWQDSWPYQANSFSIGIASANNNARLTWGTQYGFLGQQSYAVNNGLVASAPGWPKKSYSTYIVLGPHSTDPVGARVAQVGVVQGVTLTATVGSVVLSGPAGINRSDQVNYVPAGYNPVYGALAFHAANNQLDANIAVATGSLKKPLIIVDQFSASYPTLKLGNTTLLADVDYFPSLRPATQELWITLNRDLSGASNHLQIVP